MKRIQDIRTDYDLGTLNSSDLQSCPISQFKLWFNDLINSNYIEPNAMVLSTYDDKNGVQSRVVLLKEIEDDGFVFYTNYNSVKAKQINYNNCVSLCFFWPNMQRQVRVTGFASKFNNKKSEEYFMSRPRNSQLASWASNQSSVIFSRDQMDKSFLLFNKKFENQLVSKPEWWGGYKVMVKSMEFWQGRKNRMHDRFIYNKINDSWKIDRLSP
tara:strand:+ start:110 stop:748 length:639 start_codon:yes stop_codon:yes gene_type:complete